jgi:hypothetical protein
MANDVADPLGPAETFVGTIRWIALAIGVGCLALLMLVGSLAHAAVPEAAALDARLAACDAPASERFERSVLRTATLNDGSPMQLFAMPADKSRGDQAARPDGRHADCRRAGRTAHLSASGAARSGVA